MTLRDRKFYDDQYIAREKSVLQIAEEQGTYANKIRRELKRLQYEIRDRGEAMSVSLKSGRRKHPTFGGHKPETIEKIRSRMSHGKEEQQQDRGGD